MDSALKDNSKLDKSINNYFEKQLIVNGYKIFEDNWKSSLRGFQKRITDDKGIRYFLNVYHYNHGIQIPICNEYNDSYMFDTQFRLDEDGTDNTINMSFGGDFIHNEYRPITTLENAEKVFEKVWKLMGYEYYEKY